MPNEAIHLYLPALAGGASEEPPMPTNDAVRELAELLAEHGWDMAGPATCKCGWDAGDAEDWHRLLHEHVARALLVDGVRLPEQEAERVGVACGCGSTVCEDWRTARWRLEERESDRHRAERAEAELAEARARLTAVVKEAALLDAWDYCVQTWPEGIDSEEAAAAYDLGLSDAAECIASIARPEGGSDDE